MLFERKYVRAWRYLLKFQKLFKEIFGITKTTYVWNRVPYYKKLWIEAAEQCDLKLIALAEDVWEMRDSSDECVCRIVNCYVELDDPVTLHIAGDKELTYNLLTDAGLPVAEHAVYTLDTLDKLKEFTSNTTGPYVIKPASGTGSAIGVTTHLDNHDQCLQASALASIYCNRILIERFVPGEVYRLLFLEQELVSAVRRRGLSVVGDGEKSLKELVADQFPEELSGVNKDLWNSDADLATTIGLQGLQGSSVIESGCSVLAKSVSDTTTDNVEIRTVYTEEVTDTISDAIVQQCRKACVTLRSNFCGVDLILLDPTAPLGKGNGVIGEINTTPGLHHHYNLPGSNRSEDAATTVLKTLLNTRAG